MAKGGRHLPRGAIFFPFDAAFCNLGNIEYIKILLSKPLAFVKFDRASSAELALENAHTINLAGSRSLCSSKGGNA